MSSLIQTIKNEKKFLLFLLIFSFLIRALFFCCFSSKDKNHFLYDSKFYHQVADNFANEKGLSNSDGSPNFIRLPIYHLLLGFIYKIFGTDSIKALWIQIFLASFIPFLIFLLTLVLFPEKFLLAKICSLFAGIHFGYVLFSGLLMTESLYTIFFLLFLIFFLLNYEFFFCNKTCINKKLSDFLLAGIFLGIASLIRPIGQYLIVLSIILIFLTRDNFLSKLKKSLILFFSWVLIIFAWILRNYLLTGFIFFTSQTGTHFLEYCATPIYMKIHDCSFPQANEKLFQDELLPLVQDKERILGRKLYEIEVSNLAQQLVLKYILENPVIAIRYAFYNMFKASIALYSSDLLTIVSSYPQCCYDKGRTFWDLIKRFFIPPIDNIYLKALIWFEILTFFLIILGFILYLMFSIFNMSMFCALLKYLPFFALMIFLSLASGFARLRLPVESFYIIFSCSFWLRLFNKESFDNEC